MIILKKWSKQYQINKQTNKQKSVKNLKLYGEKYLEVSWSLKGNFSLTNDPKPAAHPIIGFLLISRRANVSIMNCSEKYFLLWKHFYVLSIEQRREYQKFWHFYLEKSYPSSDSSISSITPYLSLSLTHTHTLIFCLTDNRTLSLSHTRRHKSIIKQKWVSKSFIFFATF